MNLLVKTKNLVTVAHICPDSKYNMQSSDIYQNYYGLSYIISGERKIITTNGIYFVYPGNISFVDIGLYQRTEPLSTQPYEIYEIRFSYDAVKDLIDIIGRDQFHALISNISCHITAEGQQLVCHIMKEMLKESKKCLPESQLLLVGMLHQLLFAVLRNQADSSYLPDIPKIEDTLIMTAISYIDQHIYENPTALEVSRLVGLSYSQFSRRFKQAVDCTYSNYLNQMKILYSQLLLTNTHNPIEKIASDLGFCNSNYFCNVFHRYSEISPTGYRKLHTT